MAQVHLTLNDQEILDFLTGNRDEAFKLMVQRIMNEIMKAESSEQIGVSKHERSEERQDYRNGTRERTLNTRIGTLTLTVPRHRNEPFHTMVFQNYKRSEAALIATMVQMVVCGVSTRKVTKVVETLCGTRFSKSTVSELCKALDKEVNEFRNRPLSDLEAPILMVDATYFKVREKHKVITKAFLVALAIKKDGYREIIGFDVVDSEDNYSWLNFFQDLRKRGLKEVMMVISDAHKSIPRATFKTFPAAAWQRCQVHLTRNILDITPTKLQKGLAVELGNMFKATTIEEARKIKNEIVADYADVAPKAMDILEAGFEDSMTVMQLPQSMRTSLRSTNMLERLNRELKRRSDALQVFPNAESVLRLMGSVAMEENDSYPTKNKLRGYSLLTTKDADLRSALTKVASNQKALLLAS